jgi:glycosyltransferase involved in cell wall biosynthesis
MRVGIIDGDLNFPTTSGKRLRSLNLLLPLASRHELLCILRGDGNERENTRCAAFLRDHGIEAHIIDDPLPRKKGLGFYARLATNLASPLPYSVASHYSPRFASAVRAIVQHRPVDVWNLEWSGYRYAIEALPGPVVLQAHNVDSLIWQRYHETATGFFQRAYVYRQWRKFERFERGAFHRADRVVFVSEADALLARERFQLSNGCVVDNGVDVAGYARVRPQPGSRSILYLGSLDWRPNRDAVDLLLNEIFPRVRQQLPEVRLQIVGRKPPEALLRRVKNMPNVELHADVPDVLPFLASSGVMAVPLRVGGGSRLKILESLAAGLPVVSTTVGAEGLHLTPGVDYTRVDGSEAMAAALIEALQDPEVAFAQARQGQATVARRYDWPMLAQKLEEVWLSVQERTEASR